MSAKEIIGQLLDSGALQRFLEKIKPIAPLNSRYKTPSFLDTRWCLAALQELGYPHRNPKTKRWLKSLQLGSLGFSQCPGEGPWGFSTFTTSSSFALMGISPRDRSGMLDYIQSFRNGDEGYSHWGEDSSLRATIYWTGALMNLKEKQLDPGTRKYLEKYLEKWNEFDQETVYYLLLILIYYKALSDRQKNRLSRDFFRFAVNDAGKLNFEQRYYLMETLYLLDPAINPIFFRFVLPCPCQSSDPKKIYQLIRVHKLLGKPLDKQKLRRAIQEKQCASGGFYGLNFLNIYVYTSLKKLLNLGGSDKPLLKVINAYKKENGLESSPLCANNPKINYWFFKSLFLMQGLTDKTAAAKTLNQLLEQEIGRDNFIDTYYLLATLKTIGAKPAAENLKLMDDLLYRQMRNTRTIMYNIYRSFVIYQIMRAERPGIKLRKFESGIAGYRKFIKASESPTGGFSHFAGQEPSIQATYHALHSLYILGQDVNQPQKHLGFILKCFQEGGFSGKPESKIPFPLFTYYAIMSILLIKTRQKQSLDSFLIL